MLKKIIRVTFCFAASLLIGSTTYAQQGFGTDTPSKASAVEMKSSNKGLLIPRIDLVSLTSFNPIRGENPLSEEKSNSLLVYNTATIGTTITPGYYYWTTDGTTGSWKRLLANDDASALALTGDVTGTLNTTYINSLQNQTLDLTTNVPTNNQVVTWDDNEKKWIPKTITPAELGNKANLSVSEGIEFTGSTDGIDALLSATGIGIANGGITPAKIQPAQGTLTDRMVMVTDEITGNVEWIAQTDIAPDTTTILLSDANTMTSTVNGVSDTTSIINSNSLVLNADALVSTVNGIASAPAVDLSKYLDNTDEQEITNFSVIGENLSITIENGNTMTVPLSSLGTDNQTITDLSLAGTTLSITLERGGAPVTVDLQALTNSTNLDDGTNTTVSGTGASGNPYQVTVNPATDSIIGAVKPGTGITVEADGTLNATPATVTNTITGHKIADITTASGTTAINETITILSQDNTGITYINENGGTGITAKIVSTDTDNLIATGTDHGAFLSAANLETTLANGTISTTNGAITVTGGDQATFKDVTLAVKADNGITVASDHVQLGGILNKPTTITITPGAGSASVPENTLAIENLPQGSATDRIVVADPVTGVLKKVNAAMPAFFYMPSIVFDISTAGTFDRNLHSIYIQQFGSPAVSSAGATQGIPTLPANQLEYYVTYYDTEIFENLSIDQNGVLTYTVKATSATGASFMNIVFVVKE